MPIEKKKSDFFIIPDAPPSLKLNGEQMETFADFSLHSRCVYKNSEGISNCAQIC